MIVTFIGHADAPDNIYKELERTVIHLIENESANTFYIGTHGRFDSIAHTVMKRAITKYPHIKVFSILAYMPTDKTKQKFDALDTILPEEVAGALPRFAISKRNYWMINKSDIVIAYVKRSFGGAAKSLSIATRKKKRIIYI